MEDRERGGTHGDNNRKGKKGRYLIHIIEGEASWGEGLIPEFETAGFTVARVPAPASSGMRLIAPRPDMIILDETVSDSLTICHQFAKTGVPVILVGCAIGAGRFGERR